MLVHHHLHTLLSRDHRRLLHQLDVRCSAVALQYDVSNATAEVEQEHVRMHTGEG